VPQYGLELACDVAAVAKLLPAVLRPGGALHLAFTLRRARPDAAAATAGGGGLLPAAAPAGGECCALRVSYSLLPTPDGGAPPPAPVRAIFPPSTSATSFARSIWDRMAWPPPPAEAPGGRGEAGTGAGGRRAPPPPARGSDGGSGGGAPAAAGEPHAPLSLALPFFLDLPELASRADSAVTVRLLGPFAGRAGQRMCLLWQLTRSSAAAPSPGGGGHGDAETLPYSVVDAGATGDWSPVDQSRGCVRLGRGAGATATVEAVVTPLAAGQIAAPQLRVRGLRPLRVEPAFILVRP